MSERKHKVRKQNKKRSRRQCWIRKYTAVCIAHFTSNCTLCPVILYVLLLIYIQLDYRNAVVVHFIILANWCVCFHSTIRLYIIRLLSPEDLVPMLFNIQYTHHNADKMAPIYFIPFYSWEHPLMERLIKRLIDKLIERVIE